MHPVVWDFAERKRAPAQQRAAAEPWLRWMLQQGQRLAELCPAAGDPPCLAESQRLLAAELLNFDWLAELLLQPPLVDWATALGPAVASRLEDLALAVSGFGTRGWLSLAVLQCVVPLSQRLLGPEHLDTLSSGINEAVQLGNLEKHAEAAVQLTRILTSSEWALGRARAP